MEGVVIWPPRGATQGNPRVLGRRPGRTIVQIAPWGSYGGTEVLYALCSDGSVWRAARDRDVGGEVVWREVPGIEAVAGGMVVGFTYGPPEPTEVLVGTEMPGGSEKQW